MKIDDRFLLPRLEHFERELRLIREPAVLASVKQQASAWAVQALPQVEEQMLAQRREFARQHSQWFGGGSSEGGGEMVPHIVPDHESKARIGGLGARLMEIFEVAYSGWIAAMVWAAGTGPLTILCIVATTFAACEGFGHIFSLYAAPRGQVPEESRQRIARIFPVSLMLWLVFLGLVYVLRTATGPVAEGLGRADSAIFAGLGISTLGLIGVGFAVHHLYNWSAKDFSRYQKLRELHGRISALIKLGEGPAPGTIPSLVPKIAMLVLVSFLAVRAQAQPKGCTFVDLSTSVNRDDRAKALLLHKHVLPSTLQKLGISDWCFVQFSSDGWTAMPLAEVYARVDALSACAAPILTESAVLFKQARDTQLRAASKKCEQARQQSAREIEQAIAASIEAMLKQNDPRKSPCTDLLDSIERLSRTPSVVAATVITDGRETCGPYRNIKPPSHPLQLIVFLVPSAKDSAVSGGILFENRKTDLLKAASWITVLPWFEFDDQTFVESSPASLAKK